MIDDDDDDGLIQGRSNVERKSHLWIWNVIMNKESITGFST